MKKWFKIPRKKLKWSIISNCQFKAPHQHLKMTHQVLRKRFFMITLRHSRDSLCLLKALEILVNHGNLAKIRIQPKFDQWPWKIYPHLSINRVLSAPLVFYLVCYLYSKISVVPEMYFFSIEYVGTVECSAVSIVSIVIVWIIVSHK